jgi:site-specific DNA-cytosine methylase
MRKYAPLSAVVALQQMHVLELFAGGGGLSYIAQRNDKVVITCAYANDINNSAAATYTDNHPQAFVSGVAAVEHEPAGVIASPAGVLQPSHSRVSYKLGLWSG